MESKLQNSAGERGNDLAKPTTLRRVRRLAFTGLKAIAAIVFTYLIIAIIGLYPVNSDFVETPNGVEIFIYSGEFHSDIIVPIQTETFDWSAHFPGSHFKADITWATHVAIGWGDRGFYLNTPTWKDLKVSTAANALLLPSQTVMHVGMQGKPLGGPYLSRVNISDEQYERLVTFMLESFERDESQHFQRIANRSYGFYDAFYEGAGSYHAFRTCNCWVGDALKSAGIKTGWFTPFPKTPSWYFPESDKPTVTEN